VRTDAADGDLEKLLNTRRFVRWYCHRAQQRRMNVDRPETVKLWRSLSSEASTGNFGNRREVAGYAGLVPSPWGLSLR
jgi:hypothetical protein